MVNVLNTKRSETRKQGYGNLYVVSTPIGNMEDITLRALKVLESVDLIAAEGLAHTKRLCVHYQIKTRLTSYNQHNQKATAPDLIRRLKSGINVALVTDAGTPGISDPGVYLINRAANEGIPITPIPGPSAVIAALSVSGLSSEQFLFLGFLPNKSGARKKVLAGLTCEPHTMVFFEAPHRIRGMLEDLREILGDREMVMLREITKVFEDVKRGSVSAILEHLTQERTRGEFTLVVSGKEGETKQPLSDRLMNRIELLLAEDAQGIRDIAEQLSRESGIAYRQIYKECLSRKQGLKQPTIPCPKNKEKQTRSAGVDSGDFIEALEPLERSFGEEK